jgi:hypothetical protein
MKKILFAAVVVFSITLVSCTSDATETNNGKTNLSNVHNELVQTQKNADSTGGQGGTTPPPKP